MFNLTWIYNVLFLLEDLVIKLDILDEYLGDTVLSITKTNIRKPNIIDTAPRM
jgi:hypothetical protein